MHEFLQYHYFFKIYLFFYRFADSLSEIENRLNNVKHVCDMLMGNLSMKQVFSVILSCGNYMNGGNIQRGQADGFSIDILPKLKDVKSRDNTTNLLQYVVRFCIVKFDSKKVCIRIIQQVFKKRNPDFSSNVFFLRVSFFFPFLLLLYIILKGIFEKLEPKLYSSKFRCSEKATKI